MSLIAHLADLHIGYAHMTQRADDGRNQRMVDFERAALLAAERVVAARPDAAVIAGDLLHETQLYPSALTGAAAFCRRFTEAGIPLIAIGGNHDEAEGAGRYNALRYLAERHGLELHLEQGTRDVAGVRLHLVSFRVISRALSGRGEISPFEFSREDPNVLVAHGYAPGEGVPEVPPDRDVRIPEEWLTDPRFACVMLGHIHHHTRLREEPPVFYSGSTERRNFGEAGERPGFWLHRFEDGKLAESEPVFIDELGDGSLPRPMTDERVDTRDMTFDELNARVRELISRAPAGAMMRVVLDNVSEEIDRQKAKASWEREFRERGGFSFEAVPRTRQITELLDVKFGRPPVDVGQGLLDFIAEQTSDLPEQEAVEIRSLAAGLVSEAREAVLAQDAD